MKDFHKRCDGKVNTVTLFKMKTGPCIGGFTRASQNSKRTVVKDKEAFLFNLTHQRKFPFVGKKYSIYTGKNRGPCFDSTGYIELAASSDPMNKNGVSVAKQSGYEITVDEQGCNMLTGITHKIDNTPFKLIELEVWQIAKTPDDDDVVEHEVEEKCPIQ